MPLIIDPRIYDDDFFDGRKGSSLVRKFPRDLAEIVTDRWDLMVSGEYVTPACPDKELLQELLEVAQIAAAVPEESRYPQFNIVASSASETGNNAWIGQRWRFDSERPLTVDELRRLAPVVDIKKSAIWVEWTEKGWIVVGLVDLGTSWHRARTGLQYWYRFPECLLVQIEGPGRMRVYQGQYRVAILSNGSIEGEGVDLDISMHSILRSGIGLMSSEIDGPKFEPLRDFDGFLFIALHNVLSSIANSISLGGHGGALIIVPEDKGQILNSVKRKYPIDSDKLRSAFIEFMNARTKSTDLYVKLEDGGKVAQEVLAAADLPMIRKHEELIEATRFVSHLAGCDGAILLTSDLRLIGFGCEITAELDSRAEIVEVKDISMKGGNLDLEQFGMRHRSAIKLVSQITDACVLVVSQDGPITSVSSKDQKVCVRKSVNLVNMNMPWA